MSERVAEIFKTFPCNHTCESVATGPRPVNRNLQTVVNNCRSSRTGSFSLANKYITTQTADGRADTCVFNIISLQKMDHQGAMAHLPAGDILS